MCENYLTEILRWSLMGHSRWAAPCMTLTSQYWHECHVCFLQVRVEGEQPSLTLCSPEQLTHIGTAADFGTCRSTRKVKSTFTAL